jgi:uncharacterized protein (DUF2147 family)
MHPRLPAAAAALILSLAALPAAAASPVGLWATPKNGGRVEIRLCGQALCGALAGSDDITGNPAFPDTQNRDPALRSRPLKGVQMLHGFTGGPAKWTGGKVYNPEDGATYSGTIELIAPDALKLKGCIVAPLCKSQVWTRVR